MAVTGSVSAIPHRRLVLGRVLGQVVALDRTAEHAVVGEQDGPHAGLFERAPDVGDERIAGLSLRLGDHHLADRQNRGLVARHAPRYAPWTEMLGALPLRQWHRQRGDRAGGREILADGLAQGGARLARLDAAAPGDRDRRPVGRRPGGRGVRARAGVAGARPRRSRWWPTRGRAAGRFRGWRRASPRSATAAEVAYVSSTDVPLLHPAFVRRVVGALDDEVDVVLPEVGGYRQPLSAAYRSDLLATVEELIAADRMRPAFLFERSRVLHMGEADLLQNGALARLDPALASVSNLNEPADYERAHALPAPEIVVERFGPLAKPPGERRRDRARVVARRGGGGRRARARRAHRGRAQRRQDHARPGAAAGGRRHSSRSWSRTRGLGASIVDMPPGGYFGKALLVDLSTGSGEPAPIEEPVLRSYIGGAGLGTWLMHRYCPAGIDPLDPRAPLMFVFSPLVGTPLTTSAKFAVVAKSPLTGRLTDALASSHFAIAGKLTGHDAIVLRGACEEPSVVVIDRDGLRTEPAGRPVGVAGGRGRGPPAGAASARPGGWPRSARPASAAFATRRSRTTDATPAGAGSAP